MNEYFAAANSANGFVGWFDDIFSTKTIDRLYIIKGGSGTGKSTLIKKAADKWCALGGECELFYCSSDVRSLDGAILHRNGKRVGIIDGTAPHMRDPRYPGAFDEIINLGDFWNTDTLISRKNDIIKLTDRKSALFADAYSELSVAGRSLTLRLAEIKKCLLSEKLEASIMRMLLKRMKLMGQKGSDSPTRRIRPISAIATQGEVTLDALPREYDLCIVSDTVGSAPFFLEALSCAAEKLRLDCDLSPMPLLPWLYEAISFPSLSLYVINSHSYKGEKREMKPINMARFLDRNKLAVLNRQRLRGLKHIEHEMMSAALDTLSEIRKVHFALEDIYRSAMDFDRLNLESEAVIEKIVM